jgi:hypothetical protein
LEGKDVLSVVFLLHLHFGGEDVNGIVIEVHVGDSVEGIQFFDE